TYNLDNGSDLVPLLTATSPAQIPGAVSAVLAQVQASDIPARAQVLAEEIAAARPELIGLQEASVWTVQPFGSPAPTATYDILGDMPGDLAARGQHYAVAVPAPAFAGALPDAAGELVALQDFNVILVRTDLPARQLTVSNPQEGLFATQASFQVGGTGPTIQDSR